MEAQKSDIESLLSNIEHSFGVNLTYDNLTAKTEELKSIFVKSKTKMNELSRLNQELLTKNKEQNTLISQLKNNKLIYEEQKEKLICQNEWLEKQIEELNQSQIGKDTQFNKIDTLERDISSFREKSSDIIRKKDSQMLGLEHQLLQVQKEKELLKLEYIKLQKSSEIQLQDMELLYKKQISLSKRVEKPGKKIKSNLQEVKKFKKGRNKEVKYHSDTEDIIDFPIRKLTKDSKKNKLTELRHQIKGLNINIEDKEGIIGLLTSQNEGLKNTYEAEINNLSISHKQLENEILSLNDENREVKVKYERVLLDMGHEVKTESDQLLHIKDVHAQLMVENNILVKECEKVKNQGFKGEDSMFRMVDDIENTKKELEHQYQKELEELQESNQKKEQDFKEEIGQLLQQNQDLSNQKQEVIDHFQKMESQVDQFEKNFEVKDNSIHEQHKEILLLKATLKETERNHLESVEELKVEIESIKESNKNVIQLYEYQNEAFKERVAKELQFLQQSPKNLDLKGDPCEYVSLINNLAQRDSVWRNLKEENKELKIKVSQLKLKTKEIKIQNIKEIAKIPSHLKNSKKISITNKSKKDSESTTLKPEREYSTQDWHQILKRTALVESENIKLSNEIHILSKNLIFEEEQKEELIEEIKALKIKTEAQKDKKIGNKKEIQTLTKTHKIEIAKLKEEVENYRKSWVDPKIVMKYKLKEKDLESQIKVTKEDLSRKRELISSLKSTQEISQKAVIEKVAKHESRKEDNDKMSRLSKEINRKDNIIKELK